MGKNHRHKKHLKSEKSKTQLKHNTKFLPKGQNVTKTEFKIRPIVIPSQLQDKVYVDGEKTLNLKDILSRLRHYNENMKIKACEDMEHLIKNNKDQLLGGNISIIVQNIAEFIQTKMPKARKAGLSMINTLLKNFPPSQVSPHFHYLSVNLRCAMTHIDRNVQEDSILFLDSFLANVPTLMAAHANQILPDFLTLISKLRNDAEFKRTLTVNLKSKYTSIGWRIVVFSRLYAFLEAILSDKVSEEMEVECDEDNITYKAEECCGKAIFKPWPSIFKPKMYVVGILSQEENENSFQKLFTTLIPLLHESWLEGAPAKQKLKEVTYLHEENAILLNCVVKVYYLLWSYLNSRNENNISNIIPLEGQKLIKHLVQNFPYSLSNRPKQQEKPNKFLSIFISNDVKCTQENQLICYLYLVLHCKNPYMDKGNELMNVIRFISGSLLTDYKASNVDITYLIMILKHILLDKVKVWSRNSIPVHKILENSVTLYDKGNLNESSRKILMKLLSDISFESLITNQTYESWLKNLPKLLLQESINEETVILMYDLCRKDKTAFLEGYLNELPIILENLRQLKILDSLVPEKIKFKIVDMIFYLPNNCKKLQLIEAIIDGSNPYSSRINYNINLRKEFNRDC